MSCSPSIYVVYLYSKYDGGALSLSRIRIYIFQGSIDNLKTALHWPAQHKVCVSDLFPDWSTLMKSPDLAFEHLKSQIVS